MNPINPAALTVLASTIGLASAQSTVGVEPDRDNTLYESGLGEFSNGLGDLFCGRTNTGRTRRCVIRFDVAGAVPANATILSAHLELVVIQSNATMPSVAALHRLTQAFGEGASLAPGNGGGGAFASHGDATWLHTFHPSAFWSNPGGDFTPASSCSFELPVIGAVATPATAALITDVQEWWADPGQNHGWLLALADESQNATARRIASREAATGRPLLNVTYLLPGETGSVGIGCPVGAANFDLQVVGPALGGTSIPLSYANAPASSIGVDFFSLGLDPFGTPLFPDCVLYLPLNLPIVGLNTFVTDAAGVAASTFAVPVGFSGALVAAQDAVLDFTVLGVSLSDAGVMILQ